MRRRLVTWIAALGVIVAAGVVIALGPEEETSQSPFETAVALGEHGVGRDIEVTFESITAAQVVSTEFGDWVGETEGVWIAVELTATSVLDRSSVYGWLLVDDHIWDGSTRGDSDAMEGHGISAGLPETGTLLFEVPRELLETATNARILVANTSDWRLDSAISIAVDLTSLTVQDEHVFPAPTRVPLA